MIKIKVEPIDPKDEADLGTATVTLNVSSNTETGRPKIESSHPTLPKALSLKVLISPHTKYGYIVDPDNHTGPTLMHCLHEFNFLNVYKFTVEEGEAYLESPPEEPLPAGAIP